jgi:hypothetical protein
MASDANSFRSASHGGQQLCLDGSHKNQNGSITYQLPLSNANPDPIALCWCLSHYNCFDIDKLLDPVG